MRTATGKIIRKCGFLRWNSKLARIQVRFVYFADYTFCRPRGVKVDNNIMLGIANFTYIFVS